MRITRSCFPAAVVALAVVSLLAGCSEPSQDELMASARGYLEKGEPRAAVIELKNALNKNANSAEARRLLGKALLAEGDPVAAEVELRKALQLGATDTQVLPDLARAMLLLGNPAKITAQFAGVALSDPLAQADLKSSVAAAYAQQDDMAKAQAEIDAALIAQPHYASALLVQAQVRARVGDVDGALQLLGDVLTRDPGNELAGVVKASLLWQGKGDAEGALDTLRKVVEVHPGNVAAHVQMVSILFREGKQSESRQQFELLKKAAPDHPETQFFEAQFAYVDGQYKRSRELTDALLKVLPSHVRALELAAAAEYHLGNDVQAQAFLVRALKVMPGLVLSRQMLAQSYLRSNQPAEAVEVLGPLLEGDKADAESLTMAGSAWMQLGDLKRADSAFKTASRLAPDNAKVRTAAATALLSSGQSDIAMRELAAVASADKGPRADLALINARISQGDFAGAMKAIDGLEAKLPGKPLPDQLRGQVSISMGDADGARRSFNAALAKDAKYFPAVAALASMEVVAGRSELARQRVIEYLQIDPKNAQAMLMLADIPSANGAPSPDALKWLADAVRADPGNPRTHIALIARQISLGDRNAALASAQAAAVVLPNDSSIMEVLGQAQLLAGQVEQAVSTFARLAALQPGNAQVQMSLAEAQVAAKDFDAARRSLKKAAELDPNLAAAWRGLAMLALHNGRTDEALAIAKAMQKRQHDDADGYAVEGDIEVQRKNWAAAIAAYRTALQYSQASEAAIKLHSTLSVAKKIPEADKVAADWEKRRPNDPAFHFYLGDVAMQKRDFAAAEAQYRKVLASQPRNAMAMNNIAWLLQQQSKPGALEMAQNANALVPNRAPILDTLAEIQAASGHLAEAIQTQKMAVSSAPRDPGLKLKLARYLIKAGEREQARESLEALARLGDRYPRQAEVAQLLKSL